MNLAAISDPPQRLGAHLEEWLGSWPPPSPGVTIVGSARREKPGWDGTVRSVIGIVSPDGTVVSVPPGWVDGVRRLGPELADISKGLPELAGRPKARVGLGVFRWSITPVDMPDVGEWVATGDLRVPSWLRPFNGDVLIAWDDHGAYGAGVGRKQHDRFGHELAVVTEPSLRGRGMARRLVTQAARRVLDDGAVPTYLHDPANLASAHVAEASGFPDLGWRILGLW